MYRISMAYRAGVGSNLVLKIKISQVIEEYGLPIEIEHANLDGVPEFDGDGIFTPPDAAAELKTEYLKRCIVGIQSIVNKANPLREVQTFLKAKEDE